MLYCDNETNKVYFSSLLEKKYTIFSENLFKILNKHKIVHDLISSSKDIWMRDFMPIQNRNNKFIRYAYNPDYLVDYKLQRTDPKKATSFLDDKDIVDMPLNLDGGNIVRERNKIICTDKIIKTNKKENDYSESETISILKNKLDIKEVIIIPKQPYDWIGHSDGLVRFIKDDKVMITSFKKEDKKYRNKLIDCLERQNLEVVELPNKGYFPGKNKKNGGWIPYINYMQVGKLIIVPIFDDEIDKKVVELFKNNFRDCTIEYLDSKDILEEGGGLNCISWNIVNSLDL